MEMTKKSVSIVSLMLLCAPAAARTLWIRGKPLSVAGSDTQVLQCGSNWQQVAADYNAAVDDYVEPDCYSFTITRDCYCPNVYKGPYTVEVVNGEIVSTNTAAMDLKTMPEIFEYINGQCVEGCPEVGAASCTIVYDETDSYIRSVEIDSTLDFIDDEISWQITDYSECS